MNKTMQQMRRRWLLAFLLAGLLATGSFYVPGMVETASACQFPGGGGC